MPNRKGLHILPSDVSHVRIIKKLPIETNQGERFFYGKIYLRPKTFLPFPGVKHGAQRVFLKRMNWIGDMSMYNAERELALHNTIRSLGLPIPKSGIVKIEQGENKGVYLAISPFLRNSNTASRIIPINSGGKFPGRPYFLKRLTIKKDAQLIRTLAQEAALLINNGILPGWYDFVGFYKRKDGSWGHIIMDAQNMYVNHQLDVKKAFANFFMEQVAQGLGDTGSDYREHPHTSETNGRQKLEYALFERTFAKALAFPINLYNTRRFFSKAAVKKQTRTKK